MDFLCFQIFLFYFQIKKKKLFFFFLPVTPIVRTACSRWKITPPNIIFIMIKSLKQASNVESPAHFSMNFNLKSASAPQFPKMKANAEVMMNNKKYPILVP